MIDRCKFFLRDTAKMVTQKVLLPIAYAIAKLRYTGDKTLYVFADAHHTALPFSLAAMYDAVVSKGIVPVCHFYDYTHEGALKSLVHAISFMDILARAKYVFICDTFLPVSSGRKPKGTVVVQLCHFSGPIKKIGYVTNDDVPKYYKGNVFGNYDLVTASSEAYIPLLTEAMKQPVGVVQALGVSRSDVYYDKAWVDRCKEDFYASNPTARGKKILLWAPTFRGRAASPETLNNEIFTKLQAQLGEDWMVLIKHHPHDDAMAKDPRHRSNCEISTERLLPVVDLLITDYSTVVLDYLIFDKPFILYAPDLEEYEHKRGFFVPYLSITEDVITTDVSQLDQTIKTVYQRWQAGDRETINRCKDMFISACDGKATQRILDYLEQLH